MNLRRWILIGFGIIGLTTGFVVYMAARDRPVNSPDPAPLADTDAIPAAPVTRSEAQNVIPKDQQTQNDHEPAETESIGGAVWKSRDASEYVLDQPEQSGATGHFPPNSVSSGSRSMDEASNSTVPELEAVGELTDVPVAPTAEAISPNAEILPTYSDPMSIVSGSQVTGPLPGEGEPEYFGPLPGENEPDYVGPLPGENEPPYAGPLPGDNELQATGPLPGQEGSP